MKVGSTRMARPVQACGLEEGQQDKDERIHAPRIAGYSNKTMVKALFYSAKQEQFSMELST